MPWHRRKRMLVYFVGTVIVSALVLYWWPRAAPYAQFKTDSYVQAIDFSPDSKLLASGAVDGKITIWDVDAKQVRAALRGHRAEVRCLVFAPDGKMIASGGCDSQVRLWDPESGRELASLGVHKGWVLTVAFSPDSKILATAGGGPESSQGEVYLWDIFQRKLRLSLGTFENRVRALAFSPDGKFLVTRTEDGPTDIWDVVTGVKVRTLSVSSLGYHVLAFSPDGTMIAAGDWEPSAGIEAPHIVVVMNAETGQKLARFMRGSRFGVSSLSFSRDSKLLAIGSTASSGSLEKMGELKLFDVKGGQEIASRRYSRELYRVAFSTNGEFLATAGGSARHGQIILWKMSALLP